MKLGNWNTDRILGLSAMLISLLTLVIFIYQTNIMSRQSRLSVTPRLVFNYAETSQDSMLGFELSLANKGLGPAIIESISILDLDRIKSHGSDFGAFITQQYPIMDEYNVIESNTLLSTGSTISEDESITLFRLAFSLDIADRILEDINYNREEGLPFDVRVVYTSIYEEKWEINLNSTGHPKKL